MCAWGGVVNCSHRSDPASLQLGPQRLAGLVELADALYEDLQSCYSVYDSIFRRWESYPLLPQPIGPRGAGI